VKGIHRVSKQEVQLTPGRAYRMRLSKRQQMIFVSCERAYATSHLWSIAS